MMPVKLSPTHHARVPRRAFALFLGAIPIGLAACQAATPSPTAAPASKSAAPTSAAAKPTEAPASKPASATSPAAKATAAPIKPASTVKVAAAYGQTSVYNAPIWIAKERGFFSENNLDVDLVQLTGARITQGLLANSVQFIMSTASSTFLANLGGSDTLVVGSTINKVPWDFVVDPKKISSTADIKGKVGALALRGDFTETAVRLALRGYGLDVNRDVTLVQGFGTDAERIAALVSGGADFTVINADFRKQYQEAGMKQLFSLLDIKEEFINSGMFTTKGYAKENALTVQGFVSAMSQALHYMLTNKNGTLEVVAKITERKPEEIAPGYDFYQPVMLKIPEVTEAVVKSSLTALEGSNPNAATADPKEFFDPSYVQTLKNQGFYEKLWGTANP